MHKLALFIVFVVVVLSVFSVPLFAVEPFGANITVGSSERAPVDNPTGVQAQAGNVTGLTISGYSVTQSWQGYYGNVSGTITLADAGDNVLYNWSVAEPEGEIYATTNSSVQWPTIQCFNFTATGTYADDSSQAGGTSLFGTNVSQLEASFNIGEDDVDGVNETFSLLGSGTHDAFFTSQQEFSEGECPNTRSFSDAGSGESDKFEEVLLYEPETASVIFASIIEEESVLGFNQEDNDFQMLVLEDGHGIDTATTTYYFYVELQ